MTRCGADNRTAAAGILRHMRESIIALAQLHDKLAGVGVTLQPVGMRPGSASTKWFEAHITIRVFTKLTRRPLKNGHDRRPRRSQGCHQSPPRSHTKSANRESQANLAPAVCRLKSDQPYAIFDIPKGEGYL
jgi:hypothetical protein